jgi:MYXO-CTERM domain-containing protein
VTETQTTTVQAPPPPPTTATETASSDDDTPWGWIVLAAAVVAAALTGLLVWSRRRGRAASWSNQLADLSRRSLVTLDDVLAQGSIVTGQVQALAAEARSLEPRAPDEEAASAAARLRARLDELAATLEADRALHLGSPPPSPEQLTYSSALIRQQAERLQHLLRPPNVAGPPA